jgi:hypothetical protein
MALTTFKLVAHHLTGKGKGLDKLRRSQEFQNLNMSCEPGPRVLRQITETCSTSLILDVQVYEFESHWGQGATHTHTHT